MLSMAHMRFVVHEPEPCVPQECCGTHHETPILLGLQIRRANTTYAQSGPYVYHKVLPDTLMQQQQTHVSTNGTVLARAACGIVDASGAERSSQKSACMLCNVCMPDATMCVPGSCAYGTARHVT